MSSALRSSENSSTSAHTGRSLRDIARELRSLAQSPPEGVRLLLTGDDADCITTVHAEIDGPVGTPYEGGVFRMKLEFGADFPSQPPKGLFVTRIFHPNIAKNGEICVNTLKRDWKPTLGLRHVLIVIRCLLIEPYPESALNEEAGKLLLDDYEEYAHHARLMTSIHAMPKNARGSAITTQHGQGASATEPAKNKNVPSATDGSPVVVPGVLMGSQELTGHGALPPMATPLGLNSSIVNADSGADGAMSSSHGAHPEQNSLAQESFASLRTGRGSMAAGQKDKAEKKKQDTRKKALKRL